MISPPVAHECSATTYKSLSRISQGALDGHCIAIPALLSTALMEECHNMPGSQAGDLTCVRCEPGSVRPAVIANEDIGLVHVHSLGIVEPAGETHMNQGRPCHRKECCDAMWQPRLHTRPILLDRRLWVEIKPSEA